MMRLKNLILLGLTALLLAGMPVNGEEKNVYDQADLLSAEEEEQLQLMAESYEEEWNMNFLAVTTEDAQGKSSMEYADDFYDACFPEQEEEDGVLFLIDMDHREIYLFTSGDAIRYLTDSRIDRILDDAFEKVADEEYYGTFLAFFERTEFYLEQGIPSGQYNYDTETGEIDRYQKPKQITAVELIVALAAALAAAVGTAAWIVGKYQLKFEDFHYDAYTDSDVRMSVKEDRLVNTFVTHRRIPQNNGSSGGGSSSSVHRSSSGRSHGGGGRKF